MGVPVRTLMIVIEKPLFEGLLIRRRLLAGCFLVCPRKKEHCLPEGREYGTLDMENMSLEPFPMRFQVILFGVRFFTVLSLGTWLFVLFSVDPTTAGTPGVAIFLGALFSFIAGLLTLFLVGLSRKFLGDESAAHAFGVSFRQAFLLASFAIAMLVLARIGILAWWNALLCFAGILLIELSARRMTQEE